MSINNHFHLLKGASFSEELLSNIKKEIDVNRKLVSDFLLLDDIIAINFTHDYFETLIVTTDIEKTIFKIPFPDGSLYSGFKFRYGPHNVFACKIMLLLKYYLKDKIIISFELSHRGLSQDFIEAMEYLNNCGYDIKAEARPDNDSPRIFINSKEVLNIYDEDNSIFNSMFVIKKFD